MSTTQLLIEYLFAGLLTCLALALLLFGIGIDVRAGMPDQINEVLLSAGVFAVAYPLGIFVDELADTLSKRWVKQLRAAQGLTAGQSVLSLMTKKPEAQFAHRLFEHKRTRIRMARTLAMNCVFLLPACALVGWRHGTWQQLSICVCGLSALLFWSLWTFKQLQLGWFEALKIAWNEPNLEPQTCPQP